MRKNNLCNEKDESVSQSLISFRQTKPHSRSSKIEASNRTVGLKSEEGLSDSSSEDSEQYTEQSNCRQESPPLQSQIYLDRGVLELSLQRSQAEIRRLQRILRRTQEELQRANDSNDFYKKQALKQKERARALEDEKDEINCLLEVRTKELERKENRKRKYIRSSCQDFYYPGQVERKIKQEPDFKEDERINFGGFDSKEDHKVTERDIQKVYVQASFRWKRLARVLEVPEVNIQRIIKDAQSDSDEAEKCFSMLYEWMSNTKPLLSALCSGLRHTDVELQDLWKSLIN